MTIRSWLLACAALILFGAATPNARAEPAPDYVKPVPLYAISWGGTYGVSMILTADPTQANALQKLDGAEVGILGYVFNHPMPNTHPIYRLSKPLAGKDSPERYYTTSKAKVEQLISQGWTSEGILCHVQDTFDGGGKPLYHLSKSGAQFYTTDPRWVKLYKEVGGYKDEDGGTAAWVLIHSIEWRADYWMFANSTPLHREPGTESYPLVCRRGAGAAFGKDGVFFKFKQAEKKFDGALGEGECTWPDREMSAGEPDVLLAPMSNYFHPGRSTRDEEYWTYKVYNDGRGRMVVTGGEPGRPKVEKETTFEIKRDLSGPEIEVPDIRILPVMPPRP